MPKCNYLIEPFDPFAAPDDVWEPFFALRHAIHRESRPDPDDLPIPAEIEKKFMLDPKPHHIPYRWLAWDCERSQLLGYASLQLHHPEKPGYEENKHIAHLYVEVHRAARRLGLGQALMKTALEHPALEGIRVIQNMVVHPEGQVVCTALGGILANEGAINRLRLSEVDWNMMEDWMAEGPKRAQRVKLEIFTDVPEADLEAYCELYTETMNQQPMGKMEGLMVTTPESRREDEAKFRDVGIEWKTLITREPDGAISGLTEAMRLPGELTRMHQMLTGVQNAYRGRGLGKWLKAAMLLHIREHFPDVKLILTGNADVNAPMLSINNRMGFKRYISESEYKFELQKLRKRLA